MRLALLFTAALACAPANATDLFFENFESITANTPAITTTVASMDVNGTVDAIVPINPFGITTASTVIDLDGMRGTGQIGKGGFTVLPGFTYTLEFLVGGSQRDSNEEQFRVFILTPSGLEILNLEGTGYFSYIDFEFLKDPEFPDLDVKLGAGFVSEAKIFGTDPFVLSSISFTPNESSSLSFKFGTASNDDIGPLIDNVRFSFSATAVPEPATWAMLIAGFGLVGAAMRRRRAVATA